ncbi:hypothetical protein OT109_06150 [Phycisphaeraceae bacterium D3-23]
MSVADKHPAGSPLRWWGIRLPFYNLALAFSGAAAFCCYLLAIALFRPDLANDPEFDPGGIAVLMQAVGFCFAMILANACYLALGPGLETLLRPARPTPYRIVLFCAGTAFSVSLPFGIPLLVAIGL